jgi:alginate O-acetyltransferase complex protein AlgJ
MRESERPTREQEAIDEMAATRLAPGVAAALPALLLVLVAGWWVAEGAVGGIGWRALADSARQGWSAAAGFFAGNRALATAAAEIERAFDRDSAAARAMRPPVQALLTGLLGVGNEQAYPGRAGWVLFRSDFDYLTGPGFLAPSQLAARPGADPRDAILGLNRALAERDIALLLLPVPVKPAVHPESLGGDPALAPLRNPSELALFAELGRAGVAWLDPAPELAARARAGEPQYLRGDSHWRPEAVERVAALAAARLRALLPLPPPTVGCEREPQRIAGRGDSVALLGLPAWAPLDAAEEVAVRRVLGSGGAPWRATRGAPVLLLGDSFSNVFSQPELGWGEGAGLAEQLACALGLPVDRIALNAGGARGAREELSRELARGVDRLAGVRVVLWQFAARELAAGDWTPLELPRPTAPRDGPAMAQATGARLRGVVRAVAPLPEPGRAPYREALGAVELELEGGARALVYLWALRDGELAELAAVRPGGRLELAVDPWSAREAELGSLQRIELPGEAWWELPVYVERDGEVR